MNQRVRRSLRTAATGIAAVLLPLSALTGCVYASQDCTEGLCGIYLHGSGAHLTIEADQLLDPAAGDVTVKLEEASSGSAVFTINGEAGTCTPDESLTVSGLQVTCREIDEESMSMEISR